ncbi:MAG: Cof-type HAD-IIB family hydrolase [Cyclobacteriaceae bacterium]
MKIEAICTDIDGTLLDKTREISPRTIAAFQSLPRDFPIILASSRMPSAMLHLLKDLDRENNPLICYNGGFVLGPTISDRETDILDSKEIPIQICKQILSMTVTTGIHVSLYTHDEWHAPQHDFWTKKEETVTKVSASILAGNQVLEFWERQQKSAHKIMCMGKANEISDLFHALAGNYADQLHLYRSKDTYIEIAPKQVSKATALSLLLSQHYQVPMENVMAFGDNFNDVDLIQSVGFGVAMGNAKNEVKEVAKAMTGKNTDNGVAMMIEQYLI